MSYLIDITLKPNQIKLLKSIVNEQVELSYEIVIDSKITSDYIHTQVESLIVKTHGYYLMIKNIEIEQVDRDEYPSLLITKHVDVDLYGEITHDFELENIIVIRDVVTWIDNNELWKVTADIGIKFISKGMELVLIVQDFPDLMDLYDGKKVNVSTEKLVKKQWSMKIDDFPVFYDRREIPLVHFN